MSRQYRPNDETNPSHYRQGDKECIDVIRELLGDSRFTGFCQGNAIKYRHRAGLKGDAAVDLEKAKWYEQMAMHVMYPDRNADPRDA